jgi:hypothetical protein
MKSKKKFFKKDIADNKMKIWGEYYPLTKFPYCTILIIEIARDIGSVG